MPSSTSDTTVTPSFDGQTFATEFAWERRRYEALLSEVDFILHDLVDTASIKIHEIEKRVKTTASIINKCAEKQISDPLSLNDIAGARVICLFRSDIEKIGKLIEQAFLVISVDDKISNSTDSFGYMSVHYVCKMREDYTGPRYQKIKDIAFEIQVRTISMHAWAVISHYLDYKGEWDVPAHLKKALNALSGLFFVADDAFENFYRDRDKSRAKVDALKSAQAGDLEIDFDTLSAFLAKKFPDREMPDATIVSQLVREVKALGYPSISALDHDINRASRAITEFEKKSRELDKVPGLPFYSTVGITRAALGILSDKYFEIRGKQPIKQPPELEYQNFRKYLRE